MNKFDREERDRRHCGGDPDEYECSDPDERDPDEEDEDVEDEDDLEDEDLEDEDDEDDERSYPDDDEN